MKTPAKLARIVFPASSLTLLTVYVIYSQSGVGTASSKKKEEFMLPSSKTLTQPVFLTRKLEPTSGSKSISTDSFATPPQKP